MTPDPNDLDPRDAVIDAWARARRADASSPDFAYRVLSAARPSRRDRALRIAAVAFAVVAAGARIAAALALFVTR